MAGNHVHHGTKSGRAGTCAKLAIMNRNSMVNAGVGAFANHRTRSKRVAHPAGDTSSLDASSTSSTMHQESMVGDDTSGGFAEGS
ncbi:hypothetical protein EG329_000535 [Mollisiaceae sp. DMI_Dod_QoI]|nr:hypothetical protein EG329_000535 [Helotiales sp. DMI_Dod_QoI]